jgi:uncharacterized phage infection (PIP) family protein YhgE
MNIVGKTLVIINLVFALLVAGFLAIDFGTRTNWKDGFTKLKAELDVSRANTTNAQDTNRKLLDEKKTAEKNLNDLQKTYKAYELEAADSLEKANRKAQEEADRARAAEINLMKLTSEKGRLEAEIKDLTGLVKKRDEMVRGLQDASNKYRGEALSSEQKASSANQRSLALLEQLRQKELELVRRENIGKGGTTTAYSPRNPDYRNPPTAYVKGVVEKVDAKDSSVAQISIGSDEGLKEDNTLDVFRLTPDPVWVGTLRLTDVNHHSAVGRLLPRAGGRNALKTGDEVASRIIR